MLCLLIGIAGHKARLLYLLKGCVQILHQQKRDTSLDPPISFSKGVLGVKEPFSVVGTFGTPLLGFLRVSLNLPYAQQ